MDKMRVLKKVLTGLLMLAICFTFFVKFSHAQTTGKFSYARTCIGMSGAVYGYGIDCIPGGGTCKSVPCPPPN